jgi:hypothetical protein
VISPRDVFTRTEGFLPGEAFGDGSAACAVATERQRIETSASVDVNVI